MNNSDTEEKSRAEKITEEETKDVNREKNSDFAGWFMLSRVRQELFGVAMIGVILLHICQQIEKCGKGSKLYRFGFLYDLMFSSSGVEIFLMLSGVGLCFSYHKNKNLIAYYKRRFLRILVPYVIFAIPFWLVTDLVIEDKKMNDVWEDFFFVTFFRGKKTTFWFIIFILAMYIIYPLLFKLFCYRTGKEKSKSERMRLMIIALVLIVSLYMLLYLTKKVCPTFYNNIEIAILRIPVFVYGAYIGEKVYRRKMLSVLDILLPVIGMIQKMVLIVDRADRKIDIKRVFNARLTAFLYSTALILIFALILDMLKSADKLKILRKFLCIIGKYSLELYISHIMIRRVMIGHYGNRGFVERLYIFIPATAVLAYIIKLVSQLIIKKIYKKT